MNVSKYHGQTIFLKYYYNPGISQLSLMQILLTSYHIFKNLIFERYLFLVLSILDFKSFFERVVIKLNLSGPSNLDRYIQVLIKMFDNVLY